MHETSFWHHNEDSHGSEHLQTSCSSYGFNCVAKYKISNLNKFSQAESEFSHVIQMFRDNIAKEHFASTLVKSVSNSHGKLRESMPKYGTDLTSIAKYWNHVSSLRSKAVVASPKLESTAHFDSGFFTRCASEFASGLCSCAFHTAVVHFHFQN